MKVILWNIAGIKNAEEAKVFLEQAEVIVLQET